MRPYELRPPVRGFGLVSDFSGRVAGDLREVGDGLEPATGAGGLALANRHRQLPKISMRVALGEGDDGPLAGRARAVAAGATVALALALAVERVHVGDLHAEDLLDRVADLDLVGVGGDDERVDVRVVRGVRLLRHDRPDDDVARVLVRHWSVVLVGDDVVGRHVVGHHVVGTRGGPAEARHRRASVALLKTSQSLTSTS